MEEMVCDQVIKGITTSSLSPWITGSGRGQPPLGEDTQAALGKAQGVKN